jgi:O-antigen/teichoic acid export membrane protein
MPTEESGAEPRALKDLSRYFSTEVVNAAATVGGVAVFTRLVDPAGYGEYALTLAASGIVMAVVGEWLQASALRLVPGLRAAPRSAAIAATRFLALGAALTIALGTAVAVFVAPNRHVAILALVGGAYAALSVVFLPITVVFQASLRAGLYAKLRSALSVGRIACAVPLVVLFGRTPASLAGGSVVALAILLPIALYRLRVAIDAPADGNEIRRAKSAYFKFGLPLIGWYAASQTLNLSDRFFLEAWQGSYDVGLYAVTYSLAMGVTAGVMQPLLSTAAPLIVHAWHEHGESEARRRLRSALRALVILGPLIVAGLGIFGPSLLRLLAPARYETSGALSGVLGAGILLWFVGLFLQKELELRLDSRRLLVNLVLAAVVNLGANTVLIRSFGLIGAALATVLGYGVYVGLTLLAGWRGLPLVPARTIGSSLAATTTFVLVGILASQIDALRSALAQIFVVGPAAVLACLACLVMSGELGDLHRDITAPASVQ